tara:strand:- start:16479 stop:16814 length:336 start_codon:yes stop_codon:yes gene_type:complete
MTWNEAADDILAACMDVFGDAHTVAFVAPVVVNAEFGTGRGVFDAAHELVEMGGEGPVSTTGPVLGIRLSEFTVPPVEANEVVIDGATYRINDVQPDGQGGAKLMLKIRKV